MLNTLESYPGLCTTQLLAEYSVNMVDWKYSSFSLIWITEKSGQRTPWNQAAEIESSVSVEPNKNLDSALHEGVPLVSCHRMLEPGSSCHFFSSFFLFGQSDFQVSKTTFDPREILFLELRLLFWSSCYFLELLLGSSIWWRELGETPSAV